MYVHYHSRVNGYVNKQNCRIWDEEQPEEIQELPLHPEKTTVWYGLWAGGIIGPYFFKNEAGQNVTVNGARYRAMITDYLLPEIEVRNLNDVLFQQDGATCHTARETMALLREQFGEQLISRFGPINWPPRSCDITPLDFFLWGYVKSKVYLAKPTTIVELEANITHIIGQIPVEMLGRVIENWKFRMDHINRRENNSSHSETTISTSNNYVSMSPDVNNSLVEYKTSQSALLSPKEGNKLDIVDLGNLDSGPVQPILKNLFEVITNYLQCKMTILKDIIKGVPSYLTIKEKLSKDTFPNLFKMIQLAITLPVSSATCERSFSAMRRINNYLRSTMSQKRFSKLAMLNIERDIIVDTEIILNTFTKKK
ncbi:hypothetical protein QTP88_000766 [Uroleucon formosanum]